MRGLRKYIWVAILPFAHLVLCLAAAYGLLDAEGWSWIVVYLADSPVSLLARDKLSLILVGTLWWFLINLVLYYSTIGLLRLSRARSLPQSRSDGRK